MAIVPSTIMNSHEKWDLEMTVNQILKMKYARVAETEIMVARGDRRKIRYFHVDRVMLGDNFVTVAGSPLVHCFYILLVF